MTPANAFETSVGHFWGIWSTRDYMCARYELADTVRRVGSLDGVTEALDHMRDMLRLCRGDNMGVRDLIPPMMLQLDLDQECYDFIKWYQTEGQRSDYDWGNLDLPFLNVRGANVLEGVQYLDKKYGDVPHISALLLLKLKLLTDVIALKLTRKVIPSHLPPELWEEVEMNVIRSPISRRWAGKSSKELTNVHQKLQYQVLTLGKILRNLNEYYVYSAWWQHEGVLEILQSAKAIAGKDSEDEIDDMMDTSTFRNNPGSERTKKELLDDVSRNRLWGYLD
ncbi:hypothetical protein PV05_08415 [Exophiala xenobiotica]|uniref:Uncharacterized protein n=1 Tax=Exophiala xenobiotica TaxID=348802 RepID=A0A0D2EDM1_9EURO|nr:uncharacterized protein PV05_08415 [Exophiala xenobiotica]KIW52795.1 hypothetical protein PV05_08415 [Exophiala xenobiotica]